MSELEQLTQLIIIILKNDNKARRESEELLKQTRIKDIDAYVTLFMALLSQSQQPEIRMFCAVHLRSILSYFAESFQTSWPNLKGTTHSLIKQHLFDILNREKEKIVRKALCDLIGEIGATINLFEDEPEKVAVEGRDWADLMPNIQNYMSSNDVNFIICGLKIMGVLFSYSVRNYSSHNAELKKIFEKFLVNDNIQIRASALGAFACLVENAEPSECKIFEDLIAKVLVTAVEIVLAEEDLGSEVIGYLMQFVEAEPSLFKPYIRDLIQGMMKIVEKKMDFDGPKETAIEIIVIFFERRPKLGRKDQELLKEVFKLIFTYMVLSADDPDDDWKSPKEGFVESAEKGEIDEASVKFSMHMIDRMIAAMEDDKTIEVVSVVISDLVRNDDWRCRHAALMALSQVGEYIEDLNQLKEIVIFILNYAYDAHPKVRYAFLHAIGQIADDMHPDFQEKFHEDVIPLLLKTLNDSVPRVVAHAFAAMTNFLEGCKRPHIINRIKEILEPSLYAIRNCISLIKENAMSTISALAEAANTEFRPYWEETAGIVFEILKNATQPEYKQLRGQAIECLTLIGSAVGREEFAKGAKEIIFAMLQIQKNYIEDIDPQKSYLLSGWQRICIILQEDFLPFVDEILPSLFDLVERVIKLDKDRRDNRDKQDAEKVQQAFEKPKRKFNANTSESDDLQISLNMINVFITYLKKGYLSYVERTINIMSPMLNYSISEDIRTTAAKALPGLITVIKMSGRQDANDLVRKAALSFIEQIWKTMNTEYESKVMSMFVYAIREIIVAAGDRAFTQEEIIALGNGFFQALKESEERRVEKEKLFEGDDDELDEDEDAYDEDEDPEMEEEFMLSIAAAIGALFSTHKELAYPIFETIYKTILPNVFQEEKNYRTYMFGLHLIDDIIEHLGTDLIQNELGELIKALVKFTKHETPQVRKAASFGIGVFTEKSSENAFNTYSKECITAIYESYQIQKTDDDDDRLYNDAKDQATIALGKMIRFRSQELSQVIADIIKLWVTHLPLRSNKEEARVQHEMLLDIITSANANLVFGAKGEQLPHVFRIFAIIVDTKFSTDNVKKKIQGLLTVFASNDTTKNVLVQVIEALPGDLNQKLKKVMEKTS